MDDRENELYQDFVEKLVEKTKNQIDDFYNFLRKYPYLGALHETGKALVKDINSLSKITVEDEIWYRGREVFESKLYGYKDMEPPPLTAPIKEGRFNHYGQSHFYLSESEKLCAIECSHDKKCLCWIQKVHIKKVTRILDLTVDYYRYYNNKNSLPDLPLSVAGLLLSGSLTRELKSEGSWKPEYFVPRFIADVCKQNGLNGIKYPSALSYGSNLVVFDFENLDYSFEKKPYIFASK